MSKVEWAMPKAFLLFGGLIFKGLAFSEQPLPFSWGPGLKAISMIVWPAFDGSLFWLLKPPVQEKSEVGDEDLSV